jgi:hypothetical protein
MEKKILKGITMIMIIAAVALMAALVSAHAQSQRSLNADVPFDFSVGGKSLNAGEYSVRAFTSSGDSVVVRNRNSYEGAIRLTRSVQARIVPQKATLVFHRYGQRYFLSEIWTPGERTGKQLLRSSEEKALENQLASTSSQSDVARSSFERIEIVAMVD